MPENIIRTQPHINGKTGQRSAIDTGGDNLVCNAYRARGRKTGATFNNNWLA
jgi:hypothetical protein